MPESSGPGQQKKAAHEVLATRAVGSPAVEQTLRTVLAAMRGTVLRMKMVRRFPPERFRLEGVHLGDAEGGEPGKRKETRTGKQGVYIPRWHGFYLFPAAKLVLSRNEFHQEVLN